MKVMIFLEKFFALTDLGMGMDMDVTLAQYENQFKALADKKRLRILKLLGQNESTCVCELTAIMEMPQSKLSYHLKILLDANLIHKETQGTWSHYSLNRQEMHRLLSPQVSKLLAD